MGESYYSRVIYSLPSLIAELKPITLKYVKFYTFTTKDHPYQWLLKLAEEKDRRITSSMGVNYIKEAMEKMKEKGVPILVHSDVFAMGYPKSYKLVNPYYDLLKTTCLNSKDFTGYTKEHGFGIFYDDPSVIVKKINSLKAMTLTVFVPLLSKKSFEEIKKETGFNLDVYRRIINNYNILRSNESETKTNADVALTIYEKIMSNVTLEQICIDYNTNADFIRKLLAENLTKDQLAEVQKALKSNSMTRYMHIKNVVDTLLLYVPNGIPINENKKMNFSVLDYYSITNMSIETILDYVNDSKNFKATDRDTMIRRAKVLNFLKVAKKVRGSLVNKISAVKDNQRITNSTGTYSIKDYIDRIFKILHANDIMPYQKNVDELFFRLVRNQPVLPLKEDAIVIAEEPKETIHK